MDSTTVMLLGLVAGAITSLGFIPQLIRSYRTKKLGDVSYYMPMILAIGMTLWLIYGVILARFPIIVANAFGVGCCMILIGMKKVYS